MATPHTNSVPVSAQAGMSAGQRWTLTVSCLAVALVIASMAALYTALPQIATATGATQAQLTWVVDGYTLALACLVLPGGALGDRYGRRIVLLIGLVIVAVGSAVPLLVAEPGWVIAARVVAGIGAALVMPSTLSILTGSFPAERHARAVGIWAGVAGSGGVLGLLGSGAALAVWSWPSIFLALTLVAAVLAVAAATVPESRDHTRARIDVAGAVSSTVTIGVFVYAISEAPEHGWTSPLVLSLIVVAVAAGAVFVAVERRSEHPLLPIELFARRGFTAGTISLTVQFLVTFGVFLLLVQYLQLILGYSPLRSALALAPMIAPLIGLSLLAPWFSSRLGLRATTVAGMAAIAAGLLLLARVDSTTSYLQLLVPVLVMSAGLGLCTAPATTAVIADTPAAKHGIAAAVNDAAREIGAAVGIAICGSVLAAGYHDRIAPALARLPEPARGPVSDSLAAALAVADSAGPAGAPLAEFARQSFLHGIHLATLAVAGIAALGAVAALAAPGPSYQPDPRIRP
ncbi:MFS transporter [Nocardia asteroides]|uniref:MFS transporter n=1 Tax=Nocardia asteroides TaxID=1824 RepID=UPI001E60761B|nr:MFS transporter [Nocardia asteroides]UGT58926.1 MFS transporter [Nocardia asteroides]